MPTGMELLLVALSTNIRKVDAELISRYTFGAIAHYIAAFRDLSDG